MAKHIGLLSRRGYFDLVLAVGYVVIRPTSSPRYLLPSYPLSTLRQMRVRSHGRKIIIL